MTAIAKTCITAHSGAILSRNGYGLYTNPFRGFGTGRVRFQFDDPTYDPTTSPLGYKTGAHWMQVSTSPNIWDYWRKGTNWSFEFGGQSYPSQARIQSPCSVLIANLEGITNIGYMFQYCTNIHDMYNFYAPDATNVYHTFENCTGVRTFDILSMESASAYYYTFAGCTSMEKAPEFEFSQYATGLTSATGMFAGCTSLVNVPLYDTSRVTDFRDMFRGCTSLEHVPLLDTGSGTSMENMFYNCHELKNTPLFDTSNVTDMRRMFTNCFSLESVPLYDTSSVRTLTDMFAYCSSIESIPLFDTSSVVDFDAMLFHCSSLKRIPLFNTSSCGSTGTSASCNDMCEGCVSVEEGALELYQQWTTQPEGYPSHHLRYADTFLNCGVNTVTGLSDLQQIPTTWGGLKEV